jgi:hypothetical protein
MNHVWHLKVHRHYPELLFDAGMPFPLIRKSKISIIRIFLSILNRSKISTIIVVLRRRRCIPRRAHSAVTLLARFQGRSTSETQIGLGNKMSHSNRSNGTFLMACEPKNRLISPWTSSVNILVLATYTEQNHFHFIDLHFHRKRLRTVVVCVEV